MPRLSNIGGLVGPVSGRNRRLFNDATGGTVTTVSNYNGTGETWRVHRFDANGTFTVNSAPLPFRVLIVGGGGGGGGTNGPGGGGGQGGGNTRSDNQILTVGNHSVSIGNGGAGSNNPFGSANSGGGSALGALTAGGGQGGAGGSAHGSCDPITNCLRADTSFSSNITGSSVTYSIRGAHWGTSGGGQAAQTNGGNGIEPNNFNSGANGGSGVVIVAYRIG